MRRAVADRRTTETQIKLTIALDGKGRYNVRTGIRFLDHMLELFARHGAPLVLKSDNGSPFTGGDVRAVLADHGVIGLYSPPYWPRR